MSPPGERSRLGRYRIERQIGRGAMGAVYLGIDPDSNRPVAIKTMALAAEFSGTDLEEVRLRFFREARTAGLLHHPDIVAIHEAAEDAGVAYIAMEYLSGCDLQHHTQAPHLLPVADVLHIGHRVADALAYAHSQGVVHRDVKPANVMVDAAKGLVKVTDFGIACITGASSTRTGMMLGTLSYISPKQLSGRRVDGRADLYSLGVTLFQLFTGRLPHEAEAMGKLLHAIVNEPAVDVRSVRPELSEPLARLLAKVMSKQPEARHRDGGELAAELRELAAFTSNRGVV